MTFKKSLLALVTMSAFGITLGSCQSIANPTTIRIQFVPSRDPGDLGTKASALEPILKKLTDDKYDFKITVGTDYAAVETALITNQLEFGFLTSSQYAEATIRDPGKVDVVLTSTRAGYAVQQDFSDIKGNTEDKLALQVQAMNGKLNGKDGIPTDYVYDGKQSAESVSYYNSLFFALTKEARDIINEKNPGLAELGYDETGQLDIDDFVGKPGVVIGLQESASGSGYVYPSLLFKDRGIQLKKVQNRSQAKGEANTVYYVQQPNHDATTLAILNGNIDGGFTFTDNRFTSQYDMEKPNPGDYDLGGKNVFKNTTAIALSAPIYNDTISTRTSLNPDIVKDVKEAFKGAIKDKEGAKILKEVYSHTGYKDAHDADYNSERDVWHKLHDKQ